MSTKSKKPAKPAAPQVKPVTRTKARRPATAEAAPVAKVPRKALKPQRSAGRIPQPVPMPEADVSPAPVIAAAPPPAAAPQPVAVTVTASIDVGFGNTLFIRGQGAGLNWSSGVAMRCEADDRWSVTLPTHGPVVFKLLVNDLSWSLGGNYEAAPGEAVLIVPRF